MTNYSEIFYELNSLEKELGRNNLLDRVVPVCGTSTEYKSSIADKFYNLKNKVVIDFLKNYKEGKIDIDYYGFDDKSTFYHKVSVTLNDVRITILPDVICQKGGAEALINFLKSNIATYHMNLNESDPDNPVYEKEVSGYLNKDLKEVVDFFTTVVNNGG